MKKVTLIGDSIRMGYQDTVREQLAGWAEVWMPEENGGNTENILKHLQPWLLDREADIIHINAGLHDLKREFDGAGPEANAVPLDAYRKNVRAILRRLRAESSATIIWALTTPVNQARHHERKGFDRHEDDVVAYNAAAREVCRDLDIPVNDLCAVVIGNNRDELLVADGVHFTAAGSELLGREVARTIRRIAG